MTDGLNDCAAPTDTNPKNLELAPPQSITATRLDQLVYSPNYYIQIFRFNLFVRSEDLIFNRSLEVEVQCAYRLRYGSLKFIIKVVLNEISLFHICFCGFVL